MNLSQKIELLIQRKQISSSQFADKIGIPRSSVSHILSGRNKPSLDVVQKILKAFPELTAEELLFDDRLLSLNPSPIAKIEVTPTSPSLFDAPEPSPSESIKNSLAEPTIVQSNLRRNRESSKNTLGSGQSTQESSQATMPSIVPTTHLSKKIERVIIFYSDGSFSESKPSD